MERFSHRTAVNPVFTEPKENLGKKQSGQTHDENLSQRYFKHFKGRTKGAKTRRFFTATCRKLLSAHINGSEKKPSGVIRHRRSRRHHKWFIVTYRSAVPQITSLHSFLAAPRRKLFITPLRHNGEAQNHNKGFINTYWEKVL